MNFTQVATRMQNDLTKLKSSYKNGSATQDQVRTELGIISEFVKLQTAILQTRIVERKLRTNLNQNLLPPAPVETELILCPDKKDMAISRVACLDYSGTAENMETCGSCPNYKETRRLLVPKD